METSGCQHVALNQSKIAGGVKVNVLRENGGVTHRVHAVLVDVWVKTGKINVLDFCVRARFCLYQQFGGIDPTPVKRASRVERIYMQYPSNCPGTFWPPFSVEENREIRIPTFPPLVSLFVSRKSFSLAPFLTVRAWSNR